MDAMKITCIAAVCHEANRMYCATLGDASQLIWNEAPQWQRDSAIAGVNFHIRNPEATANSSHDNWLRDKEEAGWVYGAEKDPEGKFHPCIVPFDELAPEQQAKDRLFKAVVDALR